MSDLSKMAEKFGQKLDEIKLKRDAMPLRCKCGHAVVETDCYCGLCGRQQLPVGKVALCEKHSGAPSDKFCTTCGERKRL